MIELLLPPLLGVILLSSLSGALGCFVIWRKMAYFGDTIAHASLLGITIGLLLKLDYSLAVIPVCLLLALMLTHWQSKQLPTDTTLGIFSHGSLAFGLVLISLAEDQRVSLQSLLVGDLLSISYPDIQTLAFATPIILMLIMLNWKSLVLSSISPELAIVEGNHKKRLDLLLTSMIAISIALGIQYVGVLLMSAMLIIPAAIARSFSSSPEAMALLSSTICIAASIAGLLGSALIDLPAGPAIVSCAVILFVFSRILTKK